MSLKSITYILGMAVVALLMYSCANIGRPGGGPRDENPPRFVKSTPLPNALNVPLKTEKLEIEFDEIVVVKDQLTKVVVSPIQKEQAIVRALGKKVTVQFRDSLKANTTYCIDFADAIQDNNEGNILDGFAMAFSTGETIDSLQISGMVLRASDLEPMQSTLVGIHDVLDDTAFMKLPLVRIARTNEYGQFTLRNLKPGKYRVFALNDLDNNYKFSRNEDLAYLTDTIEPYGERYTSMDTVFKVTGEVDTVVEGEHTRFYPNDILLSMFNEDYNAMYIKKHERVDSAKLYNLFSARMDSMPIITPISPEPSIPNWCRIERNERNDSIFHWITDKRLIQADTIVARVEYFHTDSLDNIVWAADTIKYAMKRAKGSKAKKKKKDEVVDSVPKVRELPLNFTNGSMVEIGDYLFFSFNEPLDTIVQGAFRIEHKEDTLWLPVKEPVELVPKEPWSVKDYEIRFLGEAGNSYRLTVDSAAVKSAYGAVSKAFKKEFSIKKEEEYSNLELAIGALPVPAFVQLVDRSDKVEREALLESDGSAYFSFVKPGTYYARIILDVNDNHRWDTGNYLEHIQPEEVYYYPKKLNLKKNWDVQQTWSIYEVELDKQKPDDVKKNKPKLKGKDRNKKNKKGDDEEEEDEFDEFNTGIGTDPYYTGNKYQDQRRGLGGNRPMSNLRY